MAFIHVPKPWQSLERHVTPESIFFNRRRFLKSLIGAGVATATVPLLGCQKAAPTAEELADTEEIKAATNLAFADAGRPPTNEILAATYNNFYEYGSSKNIWKQAQSLQPEDWKVEVSGLVKNPTTYDLDDLRKKFDLEERIYRFRCVEAWAMVVPWLGFPMSALLKAVEPTSDAKFVRFTSYFDPKVTKGPSFPPARFLPFPYTEGLRIAEMANELAFFAVGIYGHTLPNQHGAPIRMVVPWKYGFKGAKSLVKIEFLATQPATFWNTLSPNEYKFEANVEPDVPHIRWSQEKERLIGPGNQFAWEEVPTQLYNGYGEYVAGLYGKDKG